MKSLLKSGRVGDIGIACLTKIDIRKMLDEWKLSILAPIYKNKV